MKRNNWNTLLTVFLIILTTFFIYSADAYKPVSGRGNNSGKKLSHKYIEEVLQKRITYKRNNLRYEKQQMELERVMKIFKNNKDALDIVAHSFMSDDKETWFFFHLDNSFAKYFAKAARDYKDTIKYLMVIRGGIPSFRNSNLLPYLNVKYNPDLEAAIIDLDFNLMYAFVDSESAVFILNQRYFKEGEKIKFVYTMNTNGKKYLSEGIHLGDGWTAEIVGYNQHYRDTRHKMFNPAYPDSIFPYIYLH